MEEPTFISSYLHPRYRVEHIIPEGDQIIVHAQIAKQFSICADCRSATQRVHSYYTRVPHYLPGESRSVRLHLKVRRMRCMNQECERKTFAEQVPDFFYHRMHSAHCG